jgi:7,8-dihydro-6-hydroxymethylpterin-pyrophosphokinase
MTTKEGPVNGTDQERWMNLCEQANKERDPQKLTEVFAKIDRMLASKAGRLKG